MQPQMKRVTDTWSMMAQQLAIDRQGLIIATTPAIRDTLVRNLNMDQLSNFDVDITQTIKDPKLLPDAMTELELWCKRMYVTSPLNRQSEGHEFAVMMDAQEANRRSRIQLDDLELRSRLGLQQAAVNTIVGGEENELVPAKGDVIKRLTPDRLLKMARISTSKTDAIRPSGGLNSEPDERLSYTCSTEVADLCFLCAVPMADGDIYGTGSSAFAISLLKPNERGDHQMTASLGLLLEEFAKTRNADTMCGVVHLDQGLYGSSTHGVAGPLIH